MTTFDCPAMREAPQAVASPARAAGLPAMITFAEPETIGVVPWPGRGQECRSPTRAAGAPTMRTFGAPEMTVPPWLELSPCLTAAGIPAPPYPIEIVAPSIVTAPAAWMVKVAAE